LSAPHHLSDDLAVTLDSLVPSPRRKAGPQAGFTLFCAFSMKL
jgi:hypothetical protein